MKQPVFGSLFILNENELSEQELREFNNMMFISSGTWSGSKSQAFRLEYQKTYGKLPGLVASYAFDGMNVLIEAIRATDGPDREKIQKYLANTTFEGVTGTFRFDDKGNRLEKMSLTEIKNGIPFAVGGD